MWDKHKHACIRTHTHTRLPATVMGLLGPLPKEEGPLALRVRQLGLQPALVAFSQRAAGDAVMGSETTGHMTRTIATRSWTLPASKDVRLR